MNSRPAALAARYRRSPLMIVYVSPSGRTRIGCRTPRAAMLALSSSRLSCPKLVLGWFASGSICASGSSVVGTPARAGFDTVVNPRVGRRTSLFLSNRLGLRFVDTDVHPHECKELTCNLINFCFGIVPTPVRAYRDRHSVSLGRTMWVRPMAHRGENRDSFCKSL